MTGARGYSWPPFPPGHELSTKHGAWSERKVRPIAEEIAASLADVAPWTTAPAYAATVAAWAWAEAQCVLLRDYLDEHGVLNNIGVPVAATGLLDRTERRAASLRSQLGLDPQSMVKLLSGLAALDAPAAQQGLDALQAAGAAIRLAAEQRALEAGAGHGEEAGQ